MITGILLLETCQKKCTLVAVYKCNIINCFKTHAMTLGWGSDKCIIYYDGVRFRE